MSLTRRGLLVGAAAGGGLLVAWSLMPRSYDIPLEPGAGETAFGAWVKIAEDGVITIAVPQLEMGQGVTTILPQLVAMEMGADWRQIAVEPAPVSGAYPNLPLAAKWAPLWRPLIAPLSDDEDDMLLKRWAERHRFSVTADGTSLAAYERPCREAAATARALLCMAAAKRWDVPWGECRAAEGFITHEDKRLRFGALAAEAGKLTPPDPPPLLPGNPQDPGSGLSNDEPAFPRIDLPSKVDGSYLFAGDVRLPDMVYAAIRHGPLDQAALSSFEAEKAAGMKGLVGVVRGKRWLAAVAHSWWTAEKALAAMAPRFTVTEPVDSAAMIDQLDDAVRRGSPQRVAERGQGDDRMGTPNLALRYDVAPAMHGTVETAAATARYADGRLELWIATQAEERARRAAAEALDISPADVVLYPMPAGGSFDRRLDFDHAIEVALIARETGRPVQLLWSRWQDHLTLHPRPPVAAVLSAAVRDDGRIDSFRARLAAPSTDREFGARLFENATNWAAKDYAADEADPMVAAGMMPPYGIPDVAVDHVPVRIALPTGRIRGKADGYTVFFRESFIDEVARRYNREPLSYRMEMLGRDVRLAECLQRAARLGEWDGGKDRSGRGLACHCMGDDITGGRIALIARMRGSGTGMVVETMSAAVDIGRVVNRDIALQQIEGGLIFGLGLALGSATSYQNGLPSAARLSALNLPKLGDTPEIRIDLIESDAEPFDPGEIGVTVVAPAIANAIHSASGLRIRRIPLISENL
ncbi:xanthine dehydrogenase family protein molybdopterin-binding subunit [Altericroceibacterium endophyticum]|uniref:Molybdopterin-dependent oxidoreductase n=1 Tax=Altericroceibacterium endophyticum TaxID=1808508 RepID=A0A6I4T1T1_9SPHN|nr:molybdopterin cofactor-binding domain-containing protein [Altericroceibacterium endophyticum]MXO65164.1 molybdopterin-dependent oxidoreductase [Altericroceibacterium endophyticum]